MWFPSEFYNHRIDPSAADGCAEVCVNGRKYCFLRGGKEPGRYVLRLPPGVNRIDWAAAYNEYSDEPLTLTLDSERGLITVAVD